MNSCDIHFNSAGIVNKNTLYYLQITKNRNVKTVNDTVKLTLPALLVGHTVSLSSSSSVAGVVYFQFPHIGNL